MDAIVTAGGIPQPGDPLYEYTQGKPKAMLEICDKPMIQWVLDALCGAKNVERIVIIGLPADCGVTCDKIAAFLPNQGGMLHNIRAGMHKVHELNPQSKHLVTVSSDIPSITSEMVDWAIETAMQSDDDAYYNVITRQAMEKRYPSSKRSYVRFKDLQVCGGDMNVIRTMIGTENDATWERLIEARKNALKQAALIGFDTMFLVLFHLITLEGAVKLASKRLKLKGRAIVCPYAEIGMDVDKPFQLEIIRADLAKRITV